MKNVLNMEDIIKTGEKAPKSGNYEYAGHPEKKTSCSPTNEEKIIPLEKGEIAPPIKSCEEPALWKFRN